jgi:hypothetical protein
MPEERLTTPLPLDSAIEGLQINNPNILLAEPKRGAEGITTSPVSQALEGYLLSDPKKLGAMPSLICGMFTELSQDKKNLEMKLERQSELMKELLEKNNKLNEINAVLRTTLNAESRIKLMRNASITIGMLLISIGWKLIEKQDLFAIAVGLMAIGGLLAVFGWLSRESKELK